MSDCKIRKITVVEHIGSLLAATVSYGRRMIVQRVLSVLLCFCHVTLVNAAEKPQVIFGSHILAHLRAQLHVPHTRLLHCGD